jgi:hypothetical protein
MISPDERLLGLVVVKGCYVPHMIEEYSRVSMCPPDCGAVAARGLPDADLSHPT